MIGNKKGDLQTKIALKKLSNKKELLSINSDVDR